jgi:hypothetical protein
VSGDGVVDEAFAEAPSQAKRTSKERVRKVDTDGKCALLNLKVRTPQGRGAGHAWAPCSL